VSTTVPGRSHEDLQREEFVRSILMFQDFKGSLCFVGRAAAEAHLGRDIASALLGLVQHVDELDVIHTSAVVVLLERDFQSCKDLWQLVYAKAVDFVLTYDGNGRKGPDLLELVKEKLKGMEFSIEEWARARRPPFPEGDDVASASDQSGLEAEANIRKQSSSSSRVLVETAPTDH
jgi:hypothetical protein